MGLFISRAGSLAGGRLLLVFALSVAALGLGGCAATLPVEYAPSSSMTATGSLTVGAFAYLPATRGEVDANQLRNTALGSIKLDKNVDVYYRDAVFKELRFVGVKVDGKNRVLTGEVKQFLVDDLGYSVDWTVDTHYVVKDANGVVVYDGDKLTKNHTAKFANAFVALNAQIKDNVEALLKDPAFIKVVN